MKNKNWPRKLNEGFTLIEVLVVVVIIAILAAIVVPRILTRPEKARDVAARQDILAIQNAMDMYKLDNGIYPTTEQGINALVTAPTTPPLPNNYQQGGYLSKLPMDPWGRQYQYRNPGQHGEIDIWSYGPNYDPDKPADESKIIGNWDMHESSAPK